MHLFLRGRYTLNLYLHFSVFITVFNAKLEPKQLELDIYL